MALAKEAKFTLAGTHHTVPPLDLGQHEALATAYGSQGESKNPYSLSFDIANVLFRDAEPSIGDIRAVRTTPDDLRQAIDAVYRANGMEPAKAPKESAKAAA
jgi:hypothetical protein